VRPWIGILLLFILQIPLAPSTQGVSVQEVIFLGAYIWTIFAWLGKVALRKVKLQKHPLFWPIFIVFISFIANIIPAYYNNIDLISWLRGWYPYSTILILLVASHEFSNNYKKGYFINIFLISSSIISLWCIFLAGKTGSFLAYPMENIIGTPFNSPLYIFGAVVSISLLVTQSTVLPTFVLWVISGIHVWRLMINFRRGPVIITVISVVFVQMIVWKLPSLKSRNRITNYRDVVSVIVFASIFLIVIPYLYGSIEQYAANISDRMSVLWLGLYARLDNFLSAAALFFESPVFGRGFGADVNVSKAVLNPLYGSQAENVHNLYLSIALYGGTACLVAVIIFLGQLLRVTKRLCEYVGQTVPDSQKSLIVSIAAILCAMALLSIYSVKSTNIETWLTLSAFCGATYHYPLISHSNTKRFQ